MADGVVLNAGSGGQTAATDDCGVPGHAQIVKLAISTDGSATLIPADATNGILTDVSRVLPGTSATSLGKAEDVAHASGDVGVLAIAVRRDTPVVGAGTDGDNATFNVDADGRLYVNIHDGGNSITVDGTVAVTNGGTFAVQVDGSALTSLQLIDDIIATLGTTTYTEAATKGAVLAVVRRDADTTLVDTTNELGPLQMDARGCLKVEAFSGETLPVSLASVPSHAVTNAGTFAVQVDGNALTALQLLDDTIFADDAAFTIGTSKVSMAGFTADETATDSLDEGDAGAARITLDRKQIVTAYAHAGAGGWTPYKNLDCDETEDDIKTSAGKLGWIHVINRSTGVRYIKFYNATAANVTVGTTTPVMSFPIPTMADTNGAGFTINFGDVGVQFDTAICVAATTGVADNDTGAPGANDVVLNAGYL